MRKSIYLGLIISIFPSLCLAGNPRITKLMREKQAKMEQLEKCMGSSKGLKIAGISTLGLTAVGVAGNIAEAKVIQDYNDRIESTDKNIEKTKIEIQEKRDALDAKEEAEAKRIAAEEQAKKEGRILRNVAMQDIARINNGGYNGDKAVSHGYMPERLPDGLRSQFANAMVNFISRCRSLIGQYGIKEVSLSPSVQENWRQYLGSSPLAEDVILDDLNEHIIAECKITECNLETHNPAFNGTSLYCVSKTTTNPNEVTGGGDNGGSVQGNAQSGNGNQGNGNDQSGNGNQGNENDQSGNGNQGAQGGENGQAGNGNQGAGDGTTTKPDGTDCTADAQKTESDTEKAEYKNGVCKIIKCKTSTNEPKNGKSCVAKKAKKDKPITEWTNEEIKNNFSSYCDKALFTSGVRQDLQMCCDATYQIGSATGWDWNDNKCLCKDKYEWKDNKCVEKSKTETSDSSKDLKGKVIYYTRMLNQAKISNFKHNEQEIVVSAYDAVDDSGNKMNCPSTAEGLKKCIRVAIKQKLESLGYSNFTVVQY